MNKELDDTADGSMEDNSFKDGFISCVFHMKQNLQNSTMNKELDDTAEDDIANHNDIKYPSPHKKKHTVSNDNNLANDTKRIKLSDLGEREELNETSLEDHSLKDGDEEEQLQDLDDPDEILDDLSREYMERASADMERLIAAPTKLLQIEVTELRSSLNTLRRRVGKVINRFDDNLKMMNSNILDQGDTIKKLEVAGVFDTHNLKAIDKRMQTIDKRCVQTHQAGRALETHISEHFKQMEKDSEISSAETQSTINKILHRIEQLESQNAAQAYFMTNLRSDLLNLYRNLKGVMIPFTRYPNDSQINYQKDFKPKPQFDFNKK